MRTIKFRAWVFEEETMYYDTECMGMGADGTWWQYAEQGFYVNNKELTTDTLPDIPIDSVEEPDDYALMQYTGLKDKNGKEIYEGDILELNDRIVKVTWHNYAACFDTDFIKYISEPNEIFSGLNNASWDIFTEVIGNIYENPELLSE